MEQKYQKMMSDGTLSEKGSISSVVHISKNFGIKYLPPASNDNELELDCLDIVKNEIFSPKDGGIQDDEGIERGKGTNNNFECIFITVSRQSVNLFV